MDENQHTKARSVSPSPEVVIVRKSEANMTSGSASEDDIKSKSNAKGMDTKR